MRLPLSFEIEGRNGKVSVRFACARSDAPILENAITSIFPDIVPCESTAHSTSAWIVAAKSSERSSSALGASS